MQCSTRPIDSPAAERDAPSMLRSNPILVVAALALGTMSPVVSSQAPVAAPAAAAPVTAAPTATAAPNVVGAPAGATTATAPTSTPPRKAPPGWRLAAGRDTDDPTYCRKETVPNSRFQKERCVKLSQLQRQQVLDRRNAEIGVRSGTQCGVGSSWCQSH